VAERARFEHRSNRIVDAEELVVLPEDLHEPGLVLGEEREVLDQIEKARSIARAAQHHFERHAARLVLALDALPFEEAVPIRGQRADAAVGAVRRDAERVVPEERGNRRLVVGEVLVESRARRHAHLLELDDHPGQTVDEAHEVRPAGVERTDDAELAHEQEVVVFRRRPVDDLHALRLLAAVLQIGQRNGDAVLEKPVDLAVGGFEAHRGTVARQLIDGGHDRFGLECRVEPGQGCTQAREQNHFAPGLATEQPGRAECLVERRHRFPVERREQPHRGLLDELVLGVGVGAHAIRLSGSLGSGDCLQQEIDVNGVEREIEFAFRRPAQDAG
jgi:hypothetical protein